MPLKVAALLGELFSVASRKASTLFSSWGQDMLQHYPPTRRRAWEWRDHTIPPSIHRGLLGEDININLGAAWFLRREGNKSIEP